MARKVGEYERLACMEATHVVAVSTTDAAYIEQSYGVKSVTSISTGVNVSHFKRPIAIPPDGAGTNIAFVGSMDYLPNIEGVQWFISCVLPLIHAARPATTVALVGKFPSASMRALGDKDPRIVVTGTVPDVRPYFWNASLSIVPLLSGSGTRLKIYESMAAGTAVISTTVGAEGLLHTPGRDILIADDPRRFADACLELLENPERRNAIADAGQRLVTNRFDWSAVAAEFDSILRCVCDKQARARHDGIQAVER
jgi:glycosyltransferase involved in cell wall biosynthesis